MQQRRHRGSAVALAVALALTGCSGKAASPAAGPPAEGSPGVAESPTAAHWSIFATGPGSPSESISGAAPEIEAVAPDPPAPAGATPEWDTPHPSLSADVDDLLEGVDTGGTVRVVRVVRRDGRPVVRVRQVRGRAAARSALAEAQAAEGALAVGVDTRMRAIEDVPSETPETPEPDEPPGEESEQPEQPEQPQEPDTGQAGAAAAPANDTRRAGQWALDRLRAEDLWAQAAGGEVALTGVTVAVVDSGVAPHPDLAGVVRSGTDYVADGGDGSADGDGHGTHVAGVVAAVANNKLGVAGLAPGVRILPVRVLDDEGSGWTSDIARGIVYAADHGADVINLSLGGPYSSATATAVKYAIDRGAVVLAAAGNERDEGNPVTYPAAHPGVVGVAASDESDAIASFSNTGGYVDLAAPGVRIDSTVPGGYARMSGTSMATPYAAAVAAFLAAADPSLGPAQLAQVLTDTAVDLLQPGRDDAAGHGLVDPRAALCRVGTCAGAAPGPADAPEPASPSPSVTARPTTTTLQAGALRAAYGGGVPVTVRVLDRQTGSGLAGTPVRVCHRILGHSSPTCRTRTTDARGTVVDEVSAVASTEVHAVHPGTSSTSPSASPAVTFRVAPRVRVSVSGRRLTATVRPHARQRVVLQRWTGTRWVVRTRTRANADGRAVFRALPPARYRITVPAAAGLVATTTAGRRVR